jgi:hypothetical protein
MAEIAGCVKACLNTAGRGGIAKGGIVTQESVKLGVRTNKIQECRIRRTRLFLENREEFMALLEADISKLGVEAAKLGLKPAIRLNGTSDIRWEDIKFGILGASKEPFYPNIFARFPHIQFYDYTKIPNRRRALEVPNYHLTFSYSARPEFQPYVQKAIETYGDKVNIAVVFAKRADIKPFLNWRAIMPDMLQKMDIIDGDEHDLRFLDPKGVVVGLTAKGQNAKKDDGSGFVVRS